MIDSEKRVAGCSVSQKSSERKQACSGDRYYSTAVASCHGSEGQGTDTSREVQFPCTCMDRTVELGMSSTGGDLRF